MIQIEDIHKAQSKWARAIVEIGKRKDDIETCKIYTSQILDELYAFDQGNILFKPTKVSQMQFRLEKEGALSYFIGDNSNFPEDRGFALQPWTQVRFENADFITEERRAIAMGNYYFKTVQGDEVKVEYTFGYIEVASGQLKIDLHHSSLPYSA